MFTHSYAADMLAAQHSRELEAAAKQARLARQATSARALRPVPPARRTRHRWAFWPVRHLGNRVRIRRQEA